MSQLSRSILRPSNPAINLCSAAVNRIFPAQIRSFRRLYTHRLPRRLASLSVPVRSHNDLAATSSLASEASFSSQYASAVGAPSSLHLSQLTITDRHIFCLSVIACAAAVSATWLFCSAIPTLLAFKRAAESLEKLMDVTREELPDTMAAIRLSGMEISDLTMELSDFGQEITQGVRSSTKAVRVAEESLRRLTDFTPPARVQEEASSIIEASGPVLAQAARNIKDEIVEGRAMLQMFFSFTRFSRVVLNYLSRQTKQ
ncbi:hypothetical protein SLA2020_179370 [Shorea laevis]